MAALLFLPLGFASRAQFIANHGQSDERVRFELPVANGSVFFEDDGFTFLLYNAQQVHAAHEHEHEHGSQAASLDLIDAIAYRVKFRKGAPITVTGKGKRTDYHNYFKGHRSNWRTRVPAFDTVYYDDVYPGIDLQCYAASGGFKYEFLVAAGADASQIALDYDHVLQPILKDGAVHLSLNGIEVWEQPPLTFYSDQRGKSIESNYLLEGNTVRFEVASYDEKKAVVIDPTVVASTNTGSTGTNYGHSATYDAFGNIYGGARVLAAGYPASSGAVQLSYGGSADMGITKLNPDGSSLIWSSHLGGSSEDYVHSMVVNGLNGVVVYGKTNSADFPVTANAFDASHNGLFDIALAVFGADGDTLFGSTYLGGDQPDGSNEIFAGGYHNFKGEVEIDAFSNVLIASTSSSANFPTTSGVFHENIVGNQDGVVVKMNYNLSAMVWGTYLGGTEDDGAFGVKPADDGSVYVVGVTLSEDFDVTEGVVQDTFLGNQDAFIAQLSSNGEELVRATYYGDSLTNQGFFIQIDRNDFIYILGAWPGLLSTAGKYQGPATTPGSFIAKFSPELDTVHWVSTFTSLSQSAFLVDNCGNIYAAGNGAPGPTQVDISANAIDSNHQGFYVMALHPDADSLLYATYYGASGSHVDGGTSRFDKRGAVYQATCSAGAFPLTSNAYSGNQNGGSYDLTLFKIDFDIDAAVAQIQIGLNSTVAGCAPHTVEFTNIGSEGLTHFWDFDDDGATDTAQTPTHTFDSAGTYTVMYAVSDTAGCVLTDTAYLVIQVFDTLGPEITFPSPVCQDEVILTLDAPFSQIHWSTGAETESITTDSSGTYWASVSNACGVFNDTVEVEILGWFDLGLTNDTALCEPQIELTTNTGADAYEWSTNDTTHNLIATTSGTYFVSATVGICEFVDSVNVEIGFLNIVLEDSLVCDSQLTIEFDLEGVSYLWSTGDTLDSLSFDADGLYFLTATNAHCVHVDTFNLAFKPIWPSLPADTSICSALTIDGNTPNATGYLWFNGDTSSAITLDSAAMVWLTAFNGLCSATDTMRLDLLLYNDNTDQLQNYCDELEVLLTAPTSGNALLAWSTGDTLPAVTVNSSGRYTVIIFNDACVWHDTFDVVLGSSGIIELNDVSLCRGDSALVTLDTSYRQARWSTGEVGSRIVVRDSGLYSVEIADGSCVKEGSFRVRFTDADDHTANFAANVITPNGDGMNDALQVEISDFSTFTSWGLQVHNRWGSLVYSSSSPMLHWDGRTPTGELLAEGVYFYSIQGTTVCLDKEQVLHSGTITLLH